MTDVTQAEFAAMKGVSAQAVGQAIKDKRLIKCLVYTKGKKLPKINPVIAAQEWEQNTDHTRRTVGLDIRKKPPAAGVSDATDPTARGIYQSRMVFEAYRAKQAKLDYEKAEGKLVEADKVRSAWTKMIANAKTKIMAVPSKAKSNIPHITAADVTVLERLMREALEDIAAATGLEAVDADGA